MVFRKPRATGLYVSFSSLSSLHRHHHSTPPLHPTSTKILILSLPPLISDSKLTLRFSYRRWGTIVSSKIHRYAGSEVYL
ncbi:hypothetical protein Hanom_Chr15g01383591 [Helianthus anomalus]